MIVRPTRRQLLCGSLALAATTGWPYRTQAGPDAQQLVTVELFTSQGCSSCPPADALLTKLAARADVLALSLPVDYWDYLGWRDTLAKPGNADRQRAYAKKLGVSQPYTPQMIIDGVLDVVGGDERKVGAALETRLAVKARQLPILVETKPERVEVRVAGGAPAQATVWLLRYRPHVEVKIGGGENRGRTLGYTNIVENAAPIGMWNGKPARFTLARADLAAQKEVSRFGLVLQRADCGPILGAARIEI